MKLLISIFISLFLTFPSMAQNDWPGDSETPAEEGVCDELIVEASKGLYGLCVAYCEAHDGPVEIPDGVKISDLDIKTPHKKILENYSRKMKDGDPSMPCVNYTSACPVWSIEELNEIGTHGWASKSDFVNDTGTNAEYTDKERNGRRQFHFASVIKTGDTFRGVYQYRNDAAGIGDVRNQELTGSEYDACKQQLLDHVTQ